MLLLCAKSLYKPSVLLRLPERLLRVLNERKRRFEDAEECVIAEGVPVVRESDYRAWVSIMYGCNNFCSYCIVPYVRGRERSREPADVIKEVKELVEKGYKDITLMGQNVNSFGKERADGYDFASLLEELDRIEGDFLLRFMTSHPKDASKRLIDVMANGKHIAKCDALHHAVQLVISVLALRDHVQTKIDFGICGFCRSFHFWKNRPF